MARGSNLRREQAQVSQGPGKKLVGLAAHLSHGAPLPYATWIASLCTAYHKLPSDILRELEGDTGELFLDILASDHFMAGWEARKEALRAKTQGPVTHPEGQPHLRCPGRARHGTATRCRSGAPECPVSNS